MPRTALAFALCAALFLNGSVAWANIPAPSYCGDPQTVCMISLRMMTPPPPRPAPLAQIRPVSFKATPQ